MTKNVVALFDDLSTAQKAVSELVTAGIARDHISLVANDAAGEYARHQALTTGTTGTTTDTAVDTTTGEGHVGPVGGSLFGALVGAVVGLGALLIPGIGPVIAAGPLIGAAGAIAGAIIGGTTGGITGGLLGLGVPQEEVHHYAEGIRRGGTLVTAEVDEGMASQVENIFSKYNPVDIDLRAKNWRASGWTGFDEAAAPFTPADISRDREAYANSDTSDDALTNAGAAAATTAAAAVASGAAMAGMTSGAATGAVTAAGASDAAGTARRVRTYNRPSDTTSNN